MYSVWMDNPNYLDEIDETVDEVIVDNTVEIEYGQLQGDKQGLKKLIDKCVMYNIPVTVLTASSTYYQILDNDTISKINLIDDSTFWIAKHLQSMIAYDNRMVNDSLGYDIFNKNVGLCTNTKHLYITMNNLPKRHRCQMMDMLAKYNLIDRGAIAWRNADRATNSNSEPQLFTSGYRYRYWQPKRMYLDIEDNNTSYVNQNVLPPHYKNSFMQLVAESEEDLFMISEKTAVPLLLNKPFLIVSCKDFHKNLVNLGFKLYDEVFDYSFDKIEDPLTRIEQLVKNVHQLSNKTPEQLNQYTELLKPKLEYNRNLAIEYSKRTIDIMKPYLTKLENANYLTQLGLIRALEPHVSRL